ncbi:MAG TPA: hypothetical protein K8V20_02300 [Subdoligranulum variabile]|uniref:Uncharacterized protein n=2 Tax=Subdoligranulum TaxID=292632 RepID=A0A921II13_9FIRM|nr:hypothetical protein [Subdoligranulum variabile]
MPARTKHEPPMPQRVQPLPQAGRQPARPSEGPGLVLTAVSILCTVLGTVLLCLGVFVMKDPVPQAAPVAEQTETQPQEAEVQQPETQPESVPAESQTEEDVWSEPASEEVETGGPADPWQTADSQPEETAETDSNSQEEPVPQQEPFEDPAQEGGETATQAQETAFRAAHGQPEQPEQQPEPHQEKNLAKTILTVVGLLLLLAGTVLGIVNGLLQQAKLKTAARQLEKLEARLQEYAHQHRDPTWEEKLRFALEQVPALEHAPQEPVRPAAAPYGGAAPRPRPVNPAPVQQVPVQQDPRSLGDAAYAAQLAAGAQKAALALQADGRFEGATIDITTCLNAYRGGQDIPYHVDQTNKTVGTPYFAYLSGSRMAVLYPNPFVVEKMGLADMERQQYILKAFRVVTPSGEITPQSLAGGQNQAAVQNLTVRRVTGAVLDDQLVVVQPGQIELG